MGIVHRVLRVETWLSDNARSWRPLSDSEYRTLVGKWMEKYRPLIEQQRPNWIGKRAQEALARHLPADLILFNGVQVAEIGNLGGDCTCAYCAVDLDRIDRDLLRQNELIVCASDMSWTCMFSHETGSMFEEQLYVVGPAG